jgi:hypothetical protein
VFMTNEWSSDILHVVVIHPMAIIGIA